eukprot:5385449-Pyramimonas_sp.AAC.2
MVTLAVVVLVLVRVYPAPVALAWTVPGLGLLGESEDDGLNLAMLGKVAVDLQLDAVNALG